MRAARKQRPSHTGCKATSTRTHSGGSDGQDIEAVRTNEGLGAHGGGAQKCRLGSVHGEGAHMAEARTNEGLSVHTVGLQLCLLHDQDLEPNRDSSLGRRHQGFSHGRGHRTAALAFA